jgi:hypothetical protein
MEEQPVKQKQTSKAGTRVDTIFIIPKRNLPAGPKDNEKSEIGQERFGNLSAGAKHKRKRNSHVRVILTQPST